jgi:hypothetical protein
VLAATYVIVAGGLAWVLRRLARAPLDPPLDPDLPAQRAVA